MKRLLIPVWVLLFGPAIAVSVQGQAPLPEASAAFLDLKNRIEATYFSHNETVVATLLAQARMQLAHYPDAMYPNYYAGLINIRQGNIVRAGDRKSAYAHYRAAVKHLQAARRKVPSAENTVALANAYGKLASLQTFKMLYYGSRSKSYLEEAFKLTMHSPKNYLIAGIEIMWTPPIFGGSKKRAREFLNKALVLAHEHRETDPYVVNWATVPEILAYLAQLETLCGAPDRARQYADRALRLVPDYGFVHRDIYPQLEAAE